MKKLNRKKSIIYFVIIFFVIVAISYLYKNRKVHFVDEKMRQVICLELGKDKDYMGLTYKDLEEIEELEVGPVGTFETIEDVAKCKNLKVLEINIEITDKDASYEVYKKDRTGNLYLFIQPENKIRRIQDDLEKIFKEAKKIEDFGFTNYNESCNVINFDFLKYGKNLKEIDLAFATVSDYSILEHCNKLEDIDLWYSNIKTADSLLNLKNANRFVLTETPLAENEKEIKRLKEAFPEAEIIVD